MEEDRFEFSPLKPMLLVVFVPAIYFWFTRRLSFAAWVSNPVVPIITFVLLYFLWKYIRITILMLRLKPAVVLTSESITITAAGYTIPWTDVSNVFLSSSGGSATGFNTLKSYYVTISTHARHIL